MKVYPSRRYHPEHESRVVKSAEEDEALVGWFESPADYGVETCPGRAHDPVIAANKARHEERIAAAKAQAAIQPAPIRKNPKSKEGRSA